MPRIPTAATVVAALAVLTLSSCLPTQLSNPTKATAVPAGTRHPTLACDWDGNGTTTPTVVKAGSWDIRLPNGAPTPTGRLRFGTGTKDVAVCGDWTGNGKDLPGYYHPGNFTLRPDLNTGRTTKVVPFAGTGTPVVGDFDGDGIDTVGLYNAGRWTLTDSPEAATLRPPVTYGTARGDVPVVGDFDGDGIDTVGVVRNGQWHVTGPDNSTTWKVYNGPAGTPLVTKAAGRDTAETFTTTPGKAKATKVALFGDSLTVESRTTFLESVTWSKKAIAATAYAFGGTAPCDWIRNIQDLHGQDPQDVYVLAFTGNNLTLCTRGLTGEDLYGRYRDDMIWISAVVAPAKVILVAPPKMRLSGGRTGPVWKAYQEAAKRAPQRIQVIDGGALLTPSDTFTLTAPCLPSEPCTGPSVAGVQHNTIRSPDGIHLCANVPAVKGGDKCAPFSAGAHRYGTTIAVAVRQLLGA